MVDSTQHRVVTY